MLKVHFRDITITWCQRKHAYICCLINTVNTMSVDISVFLPGAIAPVVTGFSNYLKHIYSYSVSIQYRALERRVRKVTKKTEVENERKSRSTGHVPKGKMSHRAIMQ